MTEFTVLSFLLNMAYLVVALGVIRVALWYMNRSTGWGYWQRAIWNLPLNFAHVEVGK